jgi:hypothetical protein
MLVLLPSNPSQRRVHMLTRTSRSQTSNLASPLTACCALVFHVKTMVTAKRFLHMLPSRLRHPCFQSGAAGSNSQRQPPVLQHWCPFRTAGELAHQTAPFDTLARTRNRIRSRASLKHLPLCMMHPFQAVRNLHPLRCALASTSGYPFPHPTRMDRRLTLQQRPHSPKISSLRLLIILQPSLSPFPREVEKRRKTSWRSLKSCPDPLRHW